MNFDIEKSNTIELNIVNNTQFREIVQFISYNVYGYGEYTVFNALNPNFDELLNSYGHIITKTNIFKSKIPEIKIQHFNSLMILLDANFIGIIRSILYKIDKKYFINKNIHEIIEIIMKLLQAILNYKRFGIYEDNGDLRLGYELFMKYAINSSRGNKPPEIRDEKINYDKLFNYLLYYSNTYNYMLPLLNVKISYSDDDEVKNITINNKSINDIYSKILNSINEYTNKDKDNIIIKNSIKLEKNIKNMEYIKQFNELINAINVFNFIYLRHNNKSTEPFVECTIHANNYKQENSISLYPLSNKFYIDLIYIKMFMPSEGSDIIIDYDIIKSMKYDEDNINEYEQFKNDVSKFNDDKYKNNIYVFIHEDENKQYVDKSDCLLTLEEYNSMKDINEYQGYINLDGKKLKCELSSEQINK